jgi:hypothetical protein
VSVQLVEAAPESPFVQTGRVDCRVWERFACSVEASCQPIAARNDGDVHWPATVKDLSVKGVGLIAGRRFERGAGLAIELPATATRPADTLLAKVVHVRSLPGGKWLLGCSLISELDVDELDAILGMSHTHSPRAEADAVTPASKQCNVPGVVFRWLDGDDRVPPLRLRRLCLTGTWPLAPGTVLRARLSIAAEYQSLRLKVMSCSQDNGCWTVAYTFLDQPSAAAIDAFTLRR